MVRRRAVLSAVGSIVLLGSASTGYQGRVTGHVTGGQRRDHDSARGARDERVRFVEARPEDGFNYPYYLAEPESYRDGDAPLLMEMNNGSQRISFEEEKARAENQVAHLGHQGAWLSEKLGVPYLKPVFPEPDGNPVDASHQTSLLDRSTMLLDETDLARIDRQLLAMAEHVRGAVLPDQVLHEQVMFGGNSSEGVVAERMATMHPRSILAATGSGLNGIVTLPQAELGGHTLKYPVGTADFEAILGRPYDPEAHASVNKFYIQGGEDPKNRLLMENGLNRNNWDDEQVYDAARAVYGADMVADRFPRCYLAFRKAGVSAQFRVYPEMTHDPSPASHDLLEFYERSIAGEDVSRFGQSFELPLDRTPEVDWEATAMEVSATFRPSGDWPPPEGLVSYRWRLGDGSTAGGQRVNHTYEEPGRYDVRLIMETIAGQRAREAAEVFFNAPSFELVESQLSAETVEVGERVTLTATVSNVGTRAARIPVEVTADGQVIERSSVDLEVDAETAITAGEAFDQPGEYEFALNGVSAGTVIVEPVSTPTASPTPSPTSAPGQPGFGSGAAAVALGGVGYLAHRRAERED